MCFIRITNINITLRRTNNIHKLAERSKNRRHEVFRKYFAGASRGFPGPILALQPLPARAQPAEGAEPYI